jgi:hypothetical protein
MAATRNASSSRYSSPTASILWRSGESSWWQLRGVSRWPSRLVSRRSPEIGSRDVAGSLTVALILAWETFLWRPRYRVCSARGRRVASLLAQPRGESRRRQRRRLARSPEQPQSWASCRRRADEPRASLDLLATSPPPAGLRPLKRPKPNEPGNRPRSGGRGKSGASARAPVGGQGRSGQMRTRRRDLRPERQIGRPSRLPVSFRAPDKKSGESRSRPLFFGTGFWWQ